MDINKSKINSERFNLNVAKVNDFDSTDLGEINTFCTANGIKLLIARVSTNEISLSQLLEESQFRLMDTLVYYKHDSAKMATPQIEVPFRVENISGNENYAVEIAEISRQAFHGYFGHYHADLRLEKAVCDDIYVDWAYRSCNDRLVSDAVLGAFIEDKIEGFVTLKIHTETIGELILSGVSPKLQKQGLYQSLIYSGMKWFQQKSIKQTILSTQINNIPVQKVWARLGFEMDHSFYTFHKWFD